MHGGHIPTLSHDTPQRSLQQKVGIQVVGRRLGAVTQAHATIGQAGARVYCLAALL